MIWLAVVCALGLPAGFLLLWRVPVCSAAFPAKAVSVIVPARNEERNLPRLLTSLSKAACPAREVIVVDDASSDSTATVARELGSRVLSSRPLPAGWTGKTWACAQGAESASSDMLLFLDADTYFDSGGLDKLVGSFRPEDDNAAALSVLPFHVMREPYEELSLIFNLLMAFGAGGFGSLGRARLFGQSLLIPRELYRKSGGHAGIRGAILENFLLSANITAAGGVCRSRGGRGTLNMRMFPDGFAQLREGWTKAFADGAAASDAKVLRLAVFWLSTLCATFLLVLFAPGAWRGVFACLYLCFVLQLLGQARSIGNYRLLTCLFYPLPLIFFFAIFGQSLYRRIFKRQVTWRGRSL